MNYLIIENSKVYHISINKHSFCGLYFGFDTDMIYKNSPPPTKQRLCKSCEKAMKGEFLKKL